jgi:hypothetical protein
VRKLICLLVLLAACRSSHSTSARTGPSPANNGNETGAATPRGAVAAFLSAVRAEDLQAIAAVWGTTSGPARDALPRAELEKRELIMMGCFRHDASHVISEAPGLEGTTVFAVQLGRKGLTATTNFYVVQGPHSRYYVENGDVRPLRPAFCSI